MSSHSTPIACRLCSRLCSWLSRNFGRLFRSRADCRGIHLRTKNNLRRVDEIDAAAPDCECEKHRMSAHSPGPARDTEQLTRFVFWPLHMRSNGQIKPALFSHVETKGCSVQRELRASGAELESLVSEMLRRDAERAWRGVLLGACGDVRNIRVGDSEQRAICVYDTALPANPAHAEMCKTRSVADDGSRNEMRRALMAAFGDGVLVSPSAYRDGAVLKKLDPHLRERM